MFLKSIRLTNFKCFHSMRMDFAATGEAKIPVRKTTFLTGGNSNGKSALLQAIALVTAGSQALRYVPGLPDVFIQNKKRFAEIEATILTPQGTDMLIKLRLERGQTAAQVAAAAKAALGTADALLRQSRSGYFVAAFGSCRRPGNERTPAPAELSKEHARYIAIHTIFGPDAVMHAPDAIADEIKTSGGVIGVNALRTALNAFLPADTRFHGLSRGTIQFETPDGIIPLVQLSNGCRQTVAWVSELLHSLTHAFADFKAPMAAHGLLLIDEPDQHLHPAWQRQIHGFLTQALPNMQVVATTYAPLTAQQAGRDELYALQRNEGREVEVVPFVGEPSRMLVHQLLMSPMFGLETDESLKAEAEKAEVRAAALGSKKSAKATTATKSARRGNAAMMSKGAAPDETPEVKITTNTRSNSSTDGEDIALLQQINDALKSSSAKKDKAKDA